MGTGEEVRCSILAGVLALLGRPLGVEGLPRVDGGLGEAAGLGEAVLPLGVAGDDGLCLDKGLGLEEKKIQGYFRLRGYEDSDDSLLKFDTLCPEKPWLQQTDTPDKALKHYIMPKVHYRSASQQHASKTNTWRGNIHYTQEKLLPSGHWYWQHNQALVGSKDYYYFSSFFFYGHHLFLWPGDEQYMFQIVHEISCLCDADVNMVTLAYTVADREQTVGQGM